VKKGSETIASGRERPRGRWLRALLSGNPRIGLEGSYAGQWATLQRRIGPPRRRPL